MADKNYKKIKIVLLGDMSVGKTSLLHRFIYDTFDTGITVIILHNT